MIRIKEQNIIEKKAWDLCHKLLDDLDLSIYDVVYNSGSNLLRISIYSGDNFSASIDDCVKANRIFNQFMEQLPEEENWLPNECTLEMSSPGLDRPLNTLSHFKSSLNKIVKIETSHILEGAKSKKIEGKLVDATETFLTLEVNEEELQIPFSGVKKAKLSLELLF